MIDKRLVLPGFDCSVTAPAEVIDLLHRFYPRSLLSFHGDMQTGRRPEARFRIDQAGHGWTLWRDHLHLGTFSRPTYALLSLEMQIETAITERSDGLVAVHAGAIRTDRGAWLIAGDPESGKTSTTFQLLQLGQTFLCEEIALYDPVERLIHPYPQTLALERRFVSGFEARFGIDDGEMIQLDEQFVRFVPERMSTDPAPLAVLVLPRYRPGAPAEIRELQAEEILTEVLGYCFPPGDGEERLFDVVIDLLENTRLLGLQYGDQESARESLTRLLDSESPTH